jgi:hypothetical protein
MDEGLFHRWRTSFLHVVQESETAARLKAASLTADLKVWTSCLTAVVVRSCTAIGWRAAAKGHPLDLLPQVGQEYLSIDVMAFAAPAEGVRWPLPLAVFELENVRRKDRIAYSLWKVLCVRAELRVVFAYREESRQLVNNLCDDVIDGLTIPERAALKSETVLVVGNRGEGQTFPWGYFTYWLLDTNIGRFERI